jgi:N-acetylglucosamine kinase-like BadF-type ATPase
MKYFVGGDVGGTKTHVVIADEDGCIAGFGQSGGGNHESVGYDGLASVVGEAFIQAIASADISIDQISGAGFGIGGYDWESQRQDHLNTLSKLGIKAPVEVVNDAILGLLAGSDAGWGIAVVSGTGCNCWGWDKERKRIGRMTGLGTLMGEGAGASELIHKAAQAVSHEWSKRGKATSLTQAFINFTGARDLNDFIEGYSLGRYQLGPAAAPLVFTAAEAGDDVARSLISWAGTELGEMVNAVARQLDFQNLEFDVIMIGGMFLNGLALTQPMLETIHSVAPGAHLKRLTGPPVAGGVILGMEVAKQHTTPATKSSLLMSISQLQIK